MYLANHSSATVLLIKLSLLKIVKILAFMLVSTQLQYFQSSEDVRWVLLESTASGVNFLCREQFGMEKKQVIALKKSLEIC